MSSGRISPGSFSTGCSSPDGGDTKSVAINWPGVSHAELGRPVGAVWTLHPERLLSLSSSSFNFVLGKVQLVLHYMEPHIHHLCAYFLLLGFFLTTLASGCQGHSGGSGAPWSCRQLYASLYVGLLKGQGP